MSNDTAKKTDVQNSDDLSNDSLEAAAGGASIPPPSVIGTDTDGDGIIDGGCTGGFGGFGGGGFGGGGAGGSW